MRLPQSRLVLKSTAFSELDVCKSFIARFEAQNISADRLHLAAGSPRREYFTAYDMIDIALDPFPFTGGTTSVEGMWMGVPVVTLKGDRVISRQGESILRNVGLTDWIASDEGDYVELAVRKAEDLASLAIIRDRLREQLESSPVCDAKLFAQDLRASFEQMWQIYYESSTVHQN